MSQIRMLLSALVTVALALLGTGAAHASAGDLGFPGPSTAGAVSAPTGEKPESKLWWNDGRWWASMYSAQSHTYHIWSLNRSSSPESWVDTGTQLDNRPNSKADTLWDGTHLYVASAVFASSNTTEVGGTPTRLYRYSYNSLTQAYSLDIGYPVSINNRSVEAITLDEDTTGRLWATWTQNQRVYYNATTTPGIDSSWGTPAPLPVASASGLNADDISAIVAYGRPTSNGGVGGHVGIMWSNQTASTTYFSVHNDGDAVDSWQAPESVTVPGPKQSDDHLNVKQLQTDGSGRVWSVIKTGLDDVAGQSSSAPQIVVASRGTTGGWSRATFATVADCHTRPVLMLDSTNSLVHVYATAPETGCPFSGTPGTIFEKTSPMDKLAFPSGRGTPVMRDAASPNLNNATGSKQTVDATTGIVMLASNDAAKHYWASDESLGSAPAKPTASFTATPTSGTAPLTVQFSDTSTGTPTTWAWDFGDGGTSSEQNPQHTYQATGTYTATLTASNTGGSSVATATITVNAPPPTAPTASFTATPSSGAAPLTVQFSDTSSGTPTTWAWDFGDGGTSSEQNPQHTYQTAGTYTATLTASNTGGSSGATATITVNGPPPPPGAITVVGSQSSLSPTAVSAVTLGVPAGTSAGDVLLATFTVNNTPTVTAPAGWTPIVNPLKPDGATEIFTAYHVVGAGESDTSYSWTLSSAQKWGGGITAYRGVDTSHPLDVSSPATKVDSSGTGTSITVAGVTTVTNGAMLIGGLGADGATATTTEPSGWTEAFDSTGGKMSEHAYKLQSAAGASGSATWTISAGRAIAVWMTALRPAPG